MSTPRSTKPYSAIPGPETFASWRILSSECWYFARVVAFGPWISPSTFTRRQRKLPSGRPDEEAVTLVQPDPTWAAEYEHFKRLCRSGESNIENDLWINQRLNELTAASLAGGRP